MRGGAEITGLRGVIQTQDVFQNMDNVDKIINGTKQVQDVLLDLYRFTPFQGNDVMTSRTALYGFFKNNNLIIFEGNFTLQHF